MCRAKFLLVLTIAFSAFPVLGSDSASGKYVEARTCQVYTGPCFANGEVGSTGKDAIMAWQIEDGAFDGVELAGQSVAVVVKSSETLGFHGLDDAKTTRAILFIDVSADKAQAKALRSFAMHQTGIKAEQITDLRSTTIVMRFDIAQLAASLHVGEYARLSTRKARPTDCICSNETAYYPPLTPLKGFVPGVTIDGEVTARKLGTRWSIPDTRTAYLGSFDLDAFDVHVAKSP